MASDKMTIEEVKKLKIKLETDIMDLVKEFEKDTGVFAGYINIQRDYGDEDVPMVKEASRSNKKKPVKNVEVNMDLDLMY